MPLRLLFPLWMECWAEFMVVPSSGRVVPVDSASFWLIHSLRSRKWLGFILCDLVARPPRASISPPRASISPPRASISPPGSESSRSFSITIERPSGSEVEDDLKRGVSGAVPIPPDDAGKEEVINSLVANVEAMIKADRKITSLKQLQGHIWRTRFQNKELQGVVYDDVPEALRRWHANGIKIRYRVGSN
ncbi:uncharacterized protein LOC109712712 isoform X2 [Ananas comosus]|uniref:Uncharacterized protein LOC109712712 isoform X2 n=1 Tax=Ananas comosus TaxID=4615 RepID=A0A6P5FF57_ANACO|nr:uncharacterized protein LOC109712712 isoform X2 [Ananas comosus]